MRKTAFAILKMSGILVFAVLQSCFLFEPEIPNYPIPDSDIRIFASASAVTSVSSGSTPYSVYVQFIDNRPGAGENEFEGAEITANGLELIESFNLVDNYFKLNSGLSLAQGDELTVTIRHSIVGTITLTGTVPAGVATFDLAPPLPGPGVAYGQSTCTMSWTGNGADEYMARYSSFDSSNQFIIGRGYPVTTTSKDFTAYDLESGGSPIPYFEFRLAAMDKQEISGFGTGSCLRVESTLVPMMSNRP